MTGFLILAVLVLFVVAIWQMNKIFLLSKIRVEGEIADVASDKDNNTQGYLMIAFLIFIYAITIYCFWKWSGVLLPEAASEHGKNFDMLMLISMIILLFVQTITQFLLHYFAFKYRGEKGKKALFYADNDKLEFVWTIIPVIVLSGLIIYGLFTWSDIMYVEEDDDTIIVELYAKQFSWEARYAGKDGVLGDANVRFIEGINTLGIDASDPYAADDIPVTGEIHLPVGKQVIFKMRSQDVLHSAYMPHFRAQMNTVPGMITQFAYTPIITTKEMRQKEEIIDKVTKINKIRTQANIERAQKGEELLDMYEFDYLLLCNKICGASHYNMQMKIVVETQEEFDAWLAQQQTFAEKLEQ
jgi:cytochrome c oxidase subunit 2